MRISDWSSDVCSSDLTRFAHPGRTYKWGASRVGIGGVTDCSNLITSPDPTLSSAHSQMRAAAEPWPAMAKQEAAEGREVIRKVVNISSMAGTHGNEGKEIGRASWRERRLQDV